MTELEPSPETKPAESPPAKKPMHPLVAVGLGVITGLVLAKLIRR